MLLPIGIALFSIFCYNDNAHGVVAVGLFLQKMQEKIKEYLDWKSTYAEKASVNYRLPLERLKDYCYNKTLAEITGDDLVKFQLNLKNNFNTPTINYTMRAVKNFLSYNNRQEAGKIRVQRHMTKSHEAITEEEYKKMLGVLNSGEFWETEKIVIIRLFWETGVRVSELCDLNTLDISQERKAEIITKKTGGKTRIIKWSEETHLLLMKYLGVRLSMNQKPFLFLSEKRERPATRTIERWITKISKKAGITRHIVCHSFRHAKAMRILKLGGSVKNVQEILGHNELSPLASFHYLRNFTKQEQEVNMEKFI